MKSNVLKSNVLKSNVLKSNVLAAVSTYGRANFGSAAPMLTTHRNHRLHLCRQNHPFHLKYRFGCYNFFYIVSYKTMRWLSVLLVAYSNIVNSDTTCDELKTAHTVCCDATPPTVACPTGCASSLSDSTLSMVVFARALSNRTRLLEKAVELSIETRELGYMNRYSVYEKIGSEDEYMVWEEYKSQGSHFANHLALFNSAKYNGYNDGGDFSTMIVDIPFGIKLAKSTQDVVEYFATFGLTWRLYTFTSPPNTTGYIRRDPVYT